jgi:hypothetical protein
MVLVGWLLVWRWLGCVAVSAAGWVVNGFVGFGWLFILFGGDCDVWRFRPPVGLLMVLLVLVGCSFCLGVIVMCGGFGRRLGC